MNIERLERLAQILDGYVKDSSGRKFDLGGGWATPRTRRVGFLWRKQIECGTTACAVGLACLSGQFAADGLCYLINDDGQLLPMYDEVNNWEAVEQFFGLSRKQAHRLFYEGSYAVSTGPRAALAVARRIRNTIRRGVRAKRPRTSGAVAKIKREALAQAAQAESVKEGAA